MSPKRFLPPTYLYAAIALMVALRVVLPGPHLLRWPWTLLGLVPLVAGVILNLLADRAFKQRGTTVKPFEEASMLVTDGVFRFTRNPMYLGFVLGLIGIALLLGTLVPWLVIVAFVGVIDVVFIRAEEAMLAATFGQGWTLYRDRTRRWL